MSEKTDLSLAADLKSLRKQLAQSERAVARHKRAEESARNEVAELQKLLSEIRHQQRPKQPRKPAAADVRAQESNPSSTAGALSWGSQDAWIASMAHELKQPLTAILSYTRACVTLVEKGQMESAELLDALKQASIQAERAAELVQQLRHVAVPGALQRSMVHVHDLIRQALQLLKSELSSAQIEVELKLADSVPAVPADPAQIRLVLLNLLRNAIEALEKRDSGQRSIRVTTQHRAAEVEVAVSDTGEGLSLAAARSLFEPYHSTRSEGMGLGLALCRAVVQAHGGRLWAKPNRPRGTVFSFTLPTHGPQ